MLEIETRYFYLLFCLLNTNSKMSPSQRILRSDSEANYRVTKSVIRETPRLTVLSILPVRQMSRPTLAVIHSFLDKGLCPTRLSVGGDEGEVRGHHRDRQQDLRGDKISDHGTSGINFVSVFSAEIAETEKSLEFEEKMDEHSLSRKN